MKLSRNEREHMGAVQRKCSRCKSWFYVESGFQRMSREGANSVAKKNGSAYVMGPAVGNVCPDCVEEERLADQRP